MDDDVRYRLQARKHTGIFRERQFIDSRVDHGIVSISGNHGHFHPSV